MAPLHNTVLYTEPTTPETNGRNDPATAYAEPMQQDGPPVRIQVYITTLQIPVSYQDVLAVTPGLHARPPILPLPADPAFAPVHLPPNGFDFIFHIGVAGRGPLRIERLAHKLNYKMKDEEGQYAPVVQLPKDPAPQEPTEAERMEIQRLFAGGVVPVAAIEGPPGPNGFRGVMDVATGERLSESSHHEHQPNRGFGKGYKTFADELYTEVDVTRLIFHLKKTGIEVRLYLQRLGHTDSAESSRYTRQWTPATTFATSSSTAQLLRRSATRQSRRRTKEGVLRQR